MLGSRGLNNHLKFFLVLKNMDDIMVLMHQVVVDLEGFNENYFGIFPDEDQKCLLSLWNNEACRTPRIFISMISPAHQRCMAEWATNRTSYRVQDLVRGLDKFVKFLKGVNYTTYPKPKKTTQEKTSTIKKIIYK